MGKVKLDQDSARIRIDKYTAKRRFEPIAHQPSYNVHEFTFSAHFPRTTSTIMQENDGIRKNDHLGEHQTAGGT